MVVALHPLLKLSVQEHILLYCSIMSGNTKNRFYNLPFNSNLKAQKIKISKLITETVKTLC